MHKLLIGFGSCAQVGKDFSAITLKKHYDVESISFAAQLKADLAELFLFRNVDFYALLKDPVKKEEVRPLMVSYGQIMRQQDPDVWVKAALDNHKFRHDITVITDVRFPNEVAKLHSMGGIFIDIEAGKPPANETEAHYAPIMRKLADYTVFNFFDESYEPQLVQLVDSILKKKIGQVTDSV